MDHLHQKLSHFKHRLRNWLRKEGEKEELPSVARTIVLQVVPIAVPISMRVPEEFITRDTTSSALPPVGKMAGSPPPKGFDEIYEAFSDISLSISSAEEEGEEEELPVEFQCMYSTP